MALAEGLGLDPGLLLEAVEGGPLDLPYLRNEGGGDARPRLHAVVPPRPGGEGRAAPGGGGGGRATGMDLRLVAAIAPGWRQGGPAHGRRRHRRCPAPGSSTYCSSHLGQALAERRHGALGLVFPGLSGPYYGELIQGFESEAVETRTSVHIVCTHLRRDSDEQVLDMARRVDGVAVLGGTISDDTLARLAESMPVVVLGGGGPLASPRSRSTTGRPPQS